METPRASCWARPRPTSVRGCALPAATPQSLATDAVVRGLIGPREADRLWDRHVLNCVAIAPAMPAGAHVIDVGSGAGLPGVVLAIARPDLRVTLVESLARRTAYLEEIVDSLGLGRSGRGRSRPGRGDRRKRVDVSRETRRRRHLACGGSPRPPRRVVPAAGAHRWATRRGEGNDRAARRWPLMRMPSRVSAGGLRSCGSTEPGCFPIRPPWWRWYGNGSRAAAPATRGPSTRPRGRSRRPTGRIRSRARAIGVCVRTFGVRGPRRCRECECVAGFIVPCGDRARASAGVSGGSRRDRISSDVRLSARPPDVLPVVGSLNHRRRRWTS